MRKNKIPVWAKIPLKNKKIYEILVIIHEYCTEGCVQIIYEYILELERQINEKRKIK